MRFIAAIALFLLFANMTDSGWAGLIAAIIGFALITVWMKSKVVTGPPKSEFSGDFSHNNIALNTETGKVWLRDQSGKTRVFDRAELLRWKHTYTSHPHRNFENQLIVEVRDLAQPVWTINFMRHNDKTQAGARINYAEAAEWQARLTNWLNHA